MLFLNYIPIFLTSDSKKHFTTGSRSKRVSVFLIIRDAKGFLTWDFYFFLISLWFPSIPSTIFSGHILYFIRNRWKVLKRVRKGGFLSKPNLEIPMTSSPLRSTVKSPKTVNKTAKFQCWLIGISKRLRIFEEYFIPFITLWHFSTLFSSF